MVRKSKLDREIEKTGFSARRTNLFDLESIDEAPDIGLEYDAVYLFGDSEDISDLEECFVVDWRDEFDFDLINSLIDDPPVDWCAAPKGFYLSVCRGDENKSARKSFVEAHGVNVVTLTLANDVLKGSYEIRVFRSSLVADHWEFVLHDTVWWKAMDKNFGLRMDELFVRIRDWNDLMKRNFVANSMNPFDPAFLRKRNYRMAQNESSIDDILTQLRTSIVADIKNHLNALRQCGIEFYGYALLPPDYYTAYETAAIAVAFNQEADVETKNVGNVYYRYSVDEWQNYVHTGFNSSNDVLRMLLSRVRDQDDEIDESLVASIYGAMLDGLVSLRKQRAFGGSPYVVIWLSDSDEPVINQSAQVLNSAEVYAEYATEFCD